MAIRITALGNSLPFVADRDSLDHDGGHTIDWSLVPDAFKDATGKKFIPAGMRMIAADATVGGGMQPINDNTANCLLLTNAQEDSHTDALSGYGVIRGGVIYGNLLPGYPGVGAPVSGVFTALKTAGTGFVFLTYGDSTAA